MKQAVLASAEQIIFQDIDFDYILEPNQVLIEIKKIGVCGSDIHAYKGKHPFTPLPVVQGHEYSGVVKEVGSDVKTIKIGDKVTGRPQVTCGTCQPCLDGKYNICTNLRVEGFQAGGVAQDYFILPEDRVYVVDNTITLDEIAMIEPAAVGAHATSLISNIKSKNIVIAGAGPIGNLIAQFSKIRGAKNIIITDYNDFRLQILNDLGFINTINLSIESIEEGIKRILGDESFQVGIEAVGHQSALDSLINTIEKGGELIIVGVYEESPTINMGFVGEHELIIKGSMMYKHEDYLYTIEQLNKGNLYLKPMITQHFDFSQYNEAYQYIEENTKTTLKVIIDVNS